MTTKLDEPDMQDTAGEAGTSSKAMYSYRPPHMAGQKQDDQHEHTFSSYVRIRDVALKTCQRRWTIGKSGEKGSGISVLVARNDDDNYKTNAFTTTTTATTTMTTNVYGKYNNNNKHVKSGYVYYNE